MFDDTLTLDPYQVDGARFLASRRRAILGDGMGLGKTPQAIRAADIVCAHEVLVLCPAIGRAMWRRSFARWGRVPRRVEVYSYTKYAKDRKLRRSVEARAAEIDVLILDEAHYLKNRDSDRTQTVYGRYCVGDRITASVSHAWLLSGTIAPNHAAELWTHLRAMWPQCIPFNRERPMTFDEFALRYCEMKPGSIGLTVMRNRAAFLPELRAVLAAIMLRRTYVPGLPELLGPFEYVVEAEQLHADLARLEANIDEGARALILEMAEKGVAVSDSFPIATLRRLTGIAKAPTVGALIADEMSCGQYDKIVLFAYHTEVLDLLEQALSKFRPVRVDGKTSEKRRVDAEHQFQTDPSRRVFLGQILAAGTTITLHAAAEVGLVEMSWTPADNAQAIKRAHRYGQKRTVRARAFTLAGSIDEDVGRVLARKTRMTLELYGEL